MNRKQSDPSRGAAYGVLRAVAVDGAYANLVLPSLLRSHRLSGRDAAFTTELAYGTLRRQGTYDAVIGLCSDRALSTIDMNVLNILRIGAHQLFGMDVAPHAAVATTVDLATVVLGKGRAGFVNAVMRRMSERDLDDWLTLAMPADVSVTKRLATTHSHPEWVVTAFQRALGTWEETELALAANNQPAQVVLVARPGLCDVNELLDAGGEPARWSKFAVCWPHGDPGLLPAIRESRAGVQDEGSQLVAAALAMVPVDGADHRWLDMCAGPGGKAALLGAIATGRGARLTAIERHQHRAKLVRDVAGESVDVITADSTDAGWGVGDFDRVLVDVPCSGLGSLRRRPDARWRRDEEDVLAITSVQRDLLTHALAAVRPGGVVAYVTCSPVIGETHDVVAAVTESRSDVERIDARRYLPDMPAIGSGPDVQLWPHRHSTDAMFLSLLRRV